MHSQNEDLLVFSNEGVVLLWQLELGLASLTRDSRIYQKIMRLLEALHAKYVRDWRESRLLEGL